MEPQPQLYCLASWLKTGTNAIIVFDLQKMQPASRAGEITLAAYCNWQGKYDGVTLIIEKKRCFGDNDPELIAYHDHEWGVPSHDDKHLFEMLILEGMQAGLSWDTVLRKRPAFRKAFFQFDPAKVAAMSDKALEALLENKEIIRNRLKIKAARQNAKIFLSIQKEFGSFDAYVWKFVNNKPIIHRYHNLSQIPTTIKESDALSKDLKKRGMSFVGPKIVYAFMQAVGLVNDHILGCWKSR